MPKNANLRSSERFEMRVPPGLARALEVLADRGLLGTNKSEVAKYLLTQQIQLMVKEGSLRPADAELSSEPTA